MDDLTRKRIRLLVEEEAYDAAASEYHKMAERRPLCARELVDLGELLQLGSGETGSLQEVEDTFLSALKKDREFVPALLALGWFKFAVMDRTAEALQLFEKSLELSQALETEARDGLDQCREELEEEGANS